MSRRPASTSDFRILALLVLQWPLAAAMLTVIESGISTLPVLAIVLTLLSVAALVGPMPGLARMWIAAEFACSAHTVAFGSIHGSLLLALITATLALEFLMLLAARRLQHAALAFGLLIASSLAFSYEGWLRYRQTVQIASYVVTAEATPQTRAEVCKTSDGSIEFDVVYTWDEDASRIVPGRPASGPIWAIAGGSYAFGVGVEDHETVVARLQGAFPKKRFHNDAEVAFGTAEVYEKIRDKSLVRDETELVVYLMIQDHFRRTSDLSRIFS